VLGALVGGTLAAAGAAYQGVFRNPLADPYLLGAAAGAGLGATLVVAYAPNSNLSGDLLPISAFAGAAVAVVAAYVLGRSAGAAAGPASLVLAGVTIASFFTALQIFVQQQHVETVQAVYSWLLGRLSTAGWHEGRDHRALCGRRMGDHPHASAAARRSRGRRRGGRLPRRQRRAPSGCSWWSRRRSRRRRPSPSQG
jgi:ABC-type enterobactin transport system permease subunit